MGRGTGPQLLFFLWQETVAADTMEGVVWTVVKGFEPPRAIIFGIGISIK